MNRFCIPILACLLLTACQQPRTYNDATIVAGVMQTLTAQASTPMPVNIQTIVAQTLTAIPTRLVSQSTLTAQAPTPTQVNVQTAVAQTLTVIASRPVSQPTQSPAPAAPGAGQMPQNTSTPAPSPAPSSSAPKIMFTTVPPMGSSAALVGKVEGVNPEMYGVAVYILVGGGWWTKPYFATPVTRIAANGTWNCPYATGGYDTSATAIRAYLIPIGYNPPSISGDTNIPSDLETKAVAKVEATR